MSPPLSKTSKVFTALANGTRCRIVARLIEGERSVGVLASLLQLRQSDVSNHLAVLREAGLVSTACQGRFVFYRLAERHGSLVRALWDGLGLSSDPTLAADAWRAAAGN